MKSKKTHNKVHNFKIPKQLKKCFANLSDFINIELDKAVKLNKTLQILVGEKHSGIAELIAKTLVAIACTKIGLSNFNLEINQNTFNEKLDKDRFFKFLERIERIFQDTNINLVDEYSEENLNKVFSYPKNKNYKAEEYYKLIGEFHSLRNIKMTKNSDLKLNNVFFIGLEHVKGINEILLNKGCYTVCINVSEIFTIDSLKKFLLKVSEELSTEFGRNILLDQRFAPSTFEYIKNGKCKNLKVDLDKKIVENKYDEFLLDKMFFDNKNEAYSIETIGDNMAHEE